DPYVGAPPFALRQTFARQPDADAELHALANELLRDSQRSQDQHRLVGVPNYFLGPFERDPRLAETAIQERCSSPALQRPSRNVRLKVFQIRAQLRRIGDARRDVVDGFRPKKFIVRPHMTFRVGCWKRASGGRRIGEQSLSASPVLAESVSLAPVRPLGDAAVTRVVCETSDRSRWVDCTSSSAFYSQRATSPPCRACCHRECPQRGEPGSRTKGCRSCGNRTARAICRDPERRLRGELSRRACVCQTRRIRDHHLKPSTASIRRDHACRPWPRTCPPVRALPYPPLELHHLSAANREVAPESELSLAGEERERTSTN